MPEKDPARIGTNADSLKNPPLATGWRTGRRLDDAVGRKGNHYAGLRLGRPARGGDAANARGVVIAPPFGYL